MTCLWCGRKALAGVSSGAPVRVCQECGFRWVGEWEREGVGQDLTYANMDSPGSLEWFSVPRGCLYVPRDLG